VLFGDGGVAVAPALDPDTWQVVWPVGVAPGPRVRWRPSAEGKGRALEGVRFAATADAAEGTFSLGTPEPGGLIDRAVTVRDALKPLPGDDWAAAGDHLYQASVAAVVSDRQAEPQPAAELLDKLIPAFSDPGLVWAAPVVERVRDWLTAAGWALLPAGWRPDRPTEVADGAADGGPAGFHGGSPNSYQLRRFGIAPADGGPPWRAAEGVRSAGDVPKGYRELITAADSLPPTVAGASDLTRDVVDWPARVLAGKALDIQAVSWFEKFWAQARPHLDPQGRLPPAWKAAAEAITDLLASNFQLKAFVPQKVSELSDGIEIASKNRGTDKVQRVLRPGLLNGKQQVRLKAIVEL